MILSHYIAFASCTVLYQSIDSPTHEALKYFPRHNVRPDKRSNNYAGG